ncbi:hypothetical protein KP79_PYT18619 [Mizuhopecten yessoensis]|uniref:Uncharacterized protein n=1 Tax=Mizuhopecten yessoensis TaxID=6573 RepID=A0A210R0A7_MIZYE|nr:hypothetical protein KP79_PYT24300 [Mizuhopecten yessoensis]OWF54392.1 hypothetical protein KP79_PYT08608 [Mizuhopecten yessoensis]OWF54768.1 hypothetical protein KP79_PYT18619 [Mizuhopecten yessoensis]
MQKGTDSRRCDFISSKPIGRKAVNLVNLDNFVLIARPSSRRRIFQMSDLSTFDGTCYAYHGCNG